MTHRLISLWPPSGLARGISAVALCLQFLLASALSGCAQRTRSQDLAGRARGMNLLLFTLDTTRADRLGCYGHELARTPTLDRLAAEGVLFEWIFAPVPLTLPSHATLLTSTFPPENGIHDNARNALGPGIPTLAEIFRTNGHATAAFIAVEILDSRYGLDRGFDHYEDSIWLGAKTGSEIPANVVRGRAAEWLNATAEEPFFVWIHFYDPHRPYKEYPDFGSEASSRYDGEIAFVDQNIGLILATLEVRGVLSNTLTVVTADHGESLGNHRELYHGTFIYDSTQRVPLIFHALELLDGGKRISTSASLADVAPTLLDLYGWPVPESMSGASLLPSLAGNSMPDRPAYLETESPLLNFGWSPLYGVSKGRWLYVEAPRPELYDRFEDPDQADNLYDAESSRVSELAEELERLRNDMTTHKIRSLEVDEETTKKLQSLGYVGGSPVKTSPGGDHPDPKDRVEALHRYEIGFDRILEGKPAQAIIEFEAAVESAPRSIRLRQQLGAAYLSSGRTREAREQYVAALDLDPDYVPVLAGLANADLREGRTREGVARMRKILEIEPRYRSVRLNLANLLHKQKRYGESAEILREGLRVSPRDPRLMSQLAWVQATCVDERIRDGAAAAELAERAVALTLGSDPRSLSSLAAAQAELGRFEEALATATRARSRALATSQRGLAGLIERCMGEYRESRPCRDE